MGGTFSGTFMGINAKTNVTNVTDNALQEIKSNCNSDNQKVNTVKDVTIKLSHVHCHNITGVVQSVVAKASCTNSQTLKAIQQNVAKQIAGAQSKGFSGSASVTMYGATINTNVANISSKLKNMINEKCGMGNEAFNVYKDVTMDLSDVSCDNLRLLTQRTSGYSICALQGYAQAIQNNKILQSAGPKTNGPPLALIIIAGAVVSIVGSVAFILQKRNKKKRARHHAKHFAKHGSAPKGSTKKEAHQARCDVASARGRPPPSGCDALKTHSTKTKTKEKTSTPSPPSNVPPSSSSGVALPSKPSVSLSSLRKYASSARSTAIKALKSPEVEEGAEMAMV